VIRCVVLTQGDFYLFLKLKEFMKGHKVSSTGLCFVSTDEFIQEYHTVSAAYCGQKHRNIFVAF